MSQFSLRLFALSIACASGALGQQGSFAQLAYGGSWQTRFTLLNLSMTDLASVTLSFYGDNGSPLAAPVEGFGTTSSYAFTIPAKGARDIVLSSSDSTTTQGWASMGVGSGIVRGQSSFRFLLPGGQISEAVVPLSVAVDPLTAGNPGTCIIAFPGIGQVAAPVILVPFDNTMGQYVTSLAIANTTSAPLAVPIEFDDQSNNPLVTDTLNLMPMQHTAFVLPQTYSALAGKKGILRIGASTASVTVLGLLSNATNAMTTIIPVTQ